MSAPFGNAAFHSCAVSGSRRSAPRIRYAESRKRSARRTSMTSGGRFEPSDCRRAAGEMAASMLSPLSVDAELGRTAVLGAPGACSPDLQRFKVYSRKAARANIRFLKHGLEKWFCAHLIGGGRYGRR